MSVVVYYTRVKTQKKIGGKKERKRTNENENASLNKNQQCACIRAFFQPDLLIVIYDNTFTLSFLPPHTTQQLTHITKLPDRSESTSPKLDHKKSSHRHHRHHKDSASSVSASSDERSASPAITDRPVYLVCYDGSKDAEKTIDYMVRTAAQLAYSAALADPLRRTSSRVRAKYRARNCQSDAPACVSACYWRQRF